MSNRAQAERELRLAERNAHGDRYAQTLATVAVGWALLDVADAIRETRQPVSSEKEVARGEQEGPHA
jgi:hypothetical protein